MMKFKLFSAINILSMILSLSVCLFSITIILNVNRSDDFQERKDQIFRLQSLVTDKTSENQQFATSPVPLLYQVLNYIPQILESVQIRRLTGVAQVDLNEFDYEGYFTGASFFKLFSFKMMQGDISSLDEPFSIFITERFASILFPDQEPIGKSIGINNLGYFEIKGIIDDPQSPSHLRFDILASAATLLTLEKQGKVNKFSDNWMNFWESATYLLVRPEAEIKELEANINRLASEQFDPAEDFEISFVLQSLTSLSPGKLYNNEPGFIIPFGMLLGVSMIAVLILLITGFNYLSLASAKSLARSRENSIRKLYGAKRVHETLQHVTESVVMLLGSCIVSAAVFNFLFNLVTRFEPFLKSELYFASDISVYISFFIFSILVGIIFGQFVSFYLRKSYFTVIQKNSIDQRTNTGRRIPKILLTLQITISAMFIMLTILVYRQFTSLMNQDLGFDKSRIITIDLQGIPYEIMTNEFSNVKDIVAVSATESMPITSGNILTKAVFPDSPDTVFINILNIDYNFLDLIDIELIAGRDFIPIDGIGNESYVLVNEKTTRQMGCEDPSGAIGMTFTLNNIPVEIIGVTSNFYFSDPFQAVEQLAVRYRPADFNTLVIKYNPHADENDLIASLRQKWMLIEPNIPFTFEFYPDSLKRLFKPISFAGHILSLLSVMAVFISCLGLLGMVAYYAVSNQKGIGIRKVMGATPWTIVQYLSKNYFIIVTIAIIISIILVGIGTLLIKRKLPNSIGFDITSIAFGVFLIILIVGGTILSQTIQASQKKPVELLRYE